MSPFIMKLSESLLILCKHRNSQSKELPKTANILLKKFGLESSSKFYKNHTEYFKEINADDSKKICPSNLEDLIKNKFKDLEILSKSNSFLDFKIDDNFENIRYAKICYRGNEDKTKIFIILSKIRSISIKDIYEFLNKIDNKSEIFNFCLKYIHQIENIEKCSKLLKEASSLNENQLNFLAKVFDNPEKFFENIENSSKILNHPCVKECVYPYLEKIIKNILFIQNSNDLNTLVLHFFKFPQRVIYLNLDFVSEPRFEVYLSELKQKNIYIICNFLEFLGSIYNGNMNAFIPIIETLWANHQFHNYMQEPKNFKIILDYIIKLKNFNLLQISNIKFILARIPFSDEIFSFIFGSSEENRNAENIQNQLFRLFIKYRDLETNLVKLSANDRLIFDLFLEDSSKGIEVPFQEIATLSDADFRLLVINYYHFNLLTSGRVCRDLVIKHLYSLLFSGKKVFDFLLSCFSQENMISLNKSAIVFFDIMDFLANKILKNNSIEKSKIDDSAKNFFYLSIENPSVWKTNKNANYDSAIDLWLRYQEDFDLLWHKFISNQSTKHSLSFAFMRNALLKNNNFIESSILDKIMLNFKFFIKSFEVFESTNKLGNESHVYKLAFDFIKGFFNLINKKEILVDANFVNCFFVILKNYIEIESEKIIENEKNLSQKIYVIESIILVFKKLMDNNFDFSYITASFLAIVEILKNEKVENLEKEFFLNMFITRVFGFNNVKDNKKFSYYFFESFLVQLKRGFEKTQLSSLEQESIEISIDTLAFANLFSERVDNAHNKESYSVLSFKQKSTNFSQLDLSELNEQIGRIGLIATMSDFVCENSIENLRMRIYYEFFKTFYGYFCRKCNNMRDGENSKSENSAMNAIRLEETDLADFHSNLSRALTLMTKPYQGPSSSSSSSVSSDQSGIMNGVCGMIFTQRLAKTLGSIKKYLQDIVSGHDFKPSAKVIERDKMQE